VSHSDLVSDHLLELKAGSTPAETFRAVLPGRTPDGDLHTLIITRQGLGRDGRVWLTFNGAIKTTVQLTDPEAARLLELIGEATDQRIP
jgi:hypothetical protein